MISTSPCPFVGRWVLTLVLVFAGLDGVRTPVAADDQSHSQTVHVSRVTALSRPLWAAWTDSIVGNRSRMIQVGTVVIVIGIFILTRSTK